MIKLLIFGIILYLGYRLFVGHPLLGEQRKDQVHQENDDDYTDYEEIR